MLVQVLGNELFHNLFDRLFLAGRFRFESGNNLRLEHKGKVEPVRISSGRSYVVKSLLRVPIAAASHAVHLHHCSLVCATRAAITHGHWSHPFASARRLASGFNQ